MSRLTPKTSATARITTPTNAGKIIISSTSCSDLVPSKVRRDCGCSSIRSAIPDPGSSPPSRWRLRDRGQPMGRQRRSPRPSIARRRCPVGRRLGPGPGRSTTPVKCRANAQPAAHPPIDCVDLPLAHSPDTRPTSMRRPDQEPCGLVEGPRSTCGRSAHRSHPLGPRHGQNASAGKVGRCARHSVGGRRTRFVGLSQGVLSLDGARPPEMS